MNPHLDTLETRSHAEREAALFAALPAQVAHAQQNSAAFAEILKGVDAAGVGTRVYRWRLLIVAALADNRPNPR